MINFDTRNSHYTLEIKGIYPQIEKAIRLLTTQLDQISSAKNQQFAQSGGFPLVMSQVPARLPVNNQVVITRPDFGYSAPGTMAALPNVGVCRSFKLVRFAVFKA